MLHSFLARLEEIVEICNPQSIEVGVLVGDSRSLPIGHVAFDCLAGRVRVRAATVD